jgi:membrane-bound lytic murein transglycosylase D
VARARAQGYLAPAPEDEVPAGTRTGKARALAQGTVKSEVVDGKTRVQYGVQSGDSMWTIAQRFNVSVEQIQSWNALGKRARKGLQVGAVLTVWPGPAAAPIEVKPAAVVASADAAATQLRPAATVVPGPVPGSKPGIHQLAEGETLWSVAQQYGVSVDDLKRWNGIRHARALRPGLNLRVGGPAD